MPIFLFTDIEGSTQLWEKHSQAMPDVLRRHDTIIKEELARYGGRIIDHMGDGVYAVFEENSRPLMGALTIQKRFAAENWGEIGRLGVRMGLNARTNDKEGIDYFREGDDYFGPVVNHTSRLMNAAWGGQILLTSEVLAQDRIPPGATIVDLGKHVLRNLPQPQQIYSLEHPDLLSRAFPPLQTLSARANNLPSSTTLFIGREDELAEIDRLLADPQCRLLTLVGLGGIGKTRLALAAAAMQLEKAGEDDRFANGIYFIPLAPLNTIEHIVPTIAEALQFSFYESSSPKKQLLDYLRHKKMLLLVDNFEHLIEGAELFSEMLAGAPELTLLVTSRERLNLQSEWIFTVNGMRYPLNEAAATLEEIESYTAVQLFLNGTRKFNPGYTLTHEDKGAIVQICQMLGGLPLGVELAATWTRVLSCPEIAQEISNSLDFLSSTLRDTPQRHHSLNAVFEHSWRLLSPQEQDILKKLSVFCGGFHQNAAQQVAGAGLPQLISLMDKSMLRRHSSGRYELHEMIRQYVGQKLAENSEEERLVAIAHSNFYAEFVSHQRNRLRGPAQKLALAEMSGEIENIRMGWQRALTNRVESAIENYMIGLYHFYWIQGWTQEGADTFRAAVSALTDPIGMAGQAEKETEILLGRIMARQGAFNYRLGLHVQANRLLQESLNIFQHFNVVSELAYVYTYLGAAAYLQADYDAAEHLLQQSLQYAQTTRNQLGTTIAYHHLGLIAHTRKDYDEAQKYHQNSLALAQTLGEPFGIAVALNNLGMVAHAQGNYDEARELHRRSLALRREINDQWGIATTLNSLALIAYAQEKYDQARQLLLESLNIYREIGDRKRTAVTLKDLSYVAQAQDQPEEAERLRKESLETFPNSGRQAGVATISTTLEAS